MINKVSRKEIDDAFDYFMDTGRLEEVISDDRYYIEILLKSVANKYKWQLTFDEESKKDKK